MRIPIFAVGVLLLVGVAREGAHPHPVVAQAPVEGALPESIHSAVVAQVAARRDLAPELVVLQAVRLPQGREIDEAVAPVVKGSGNAGLWLVELADRNGDRIGVQVRAGVREPVAVAARELPRGHVLKTADIEWKEEVRFGGRSTPSPEVGWEVARTLDAGERLRSPAVRPAPAVRSGDAVKVVWSGQRVRLALDGVALGNAALGEPVAVRLTTGRRVRGVATPGGLVRLQGGER